MAVTTKEQPLLGKVATDNILLLVVDSRRYLEVEDVVKLKARRGGTSPKARLRATVFPDRFGNRAVRSRPSSAVADFNERQVSGGDGNAPNGDNGVGS